MADTQQANKRLGWRGRMYGRCRAAGRNRLAWLFADRKGREILRALRQIDHREA